MENKSCKECHNIKENFENNKYTISKYNNFKCYKYTYLTLYRKLSAQFLNIENNVQKYKFFLKGKQI